MQILTVTAAVRLAWGRMSAADLLAALLGEPVVIRHACPACGSDRHGRPTVQRPNGRTTSVSIAHAGAITLVATAPTGHLGVDLEARDGTTPPRTRHPDDPHELTDLELWVRKEAFLKACGDGLRRDPMTVGPHEPGATWGSIPIDGYVAAWCVVQQARGSFGSLRASSHAENSGARSASE